jgi:tryptophanyl-tRNA synthetase
MRPTGKLHLGNYMGALYNWVRLQNELNADGKPAYECYFFIADWHALTTDYSDPSRIKQNTLEVMLDYLAAGLHPEKSVLFVQSHVPQHAELHLLLSMITPLSWLERVPSFKDQQEQLKEKDLATYGFLGYPLLQAADILIYQPDFVPVGQDQVAHVELTREVARRFNQFYPAADRKLYDSLRKMGELPPVMAEILPEPKVMLTPSPKLPGTDGRKMSKSYGNTILLSDPLALVEEKLEKMTNGGQRLHVSDPGNPDICPVADLHKVFSSPAIDTEIRNKCRNAQFSCLDCKGILYSSLVSVLQPFQERRSKYELEFEETLESLRQGNLKATLRAEETMKLVRSAVGVSRDFAGLRPSSTFLESFKQEGQLRHNLQNYKQWWDEPHEIRNRELTGHWISQAVPRDIALNRLEESVYLAPRNRRVCILSSKEETKHEWILRTKRKSYETLVLLCWDQNFDLLDFVLPQKLYLNAWTGIEKATKEFNIRVNRVGEEYFLNIPLSDTINITEYLGSYEALR